MSDERSILYCPHCNAKYDVTDATAGRRFLCRSCRCTVTLPAHLGRPPFFRLSESRELLKPELLLDEDPNETHDDFDHAFEFTKMVATENDYVLVDAFREDVRDPSVLAQVVCHRRRGVGADGLLLFQPTTEADFEMVMFNPDGSEAEMCGNGIRCLARYAYDHEYTTETAFTVRTRAGVRDIRLTVESGAVQALRVDMGRPVLLHPAGPRVAVEAAGRTFEGVEVSVGNPHFVVFHPEPVDDLPLEEWGPALEAHPRFPSRTNVEFVQVLAPGEAVQRTHERGAGETHGCGTGATAVAAAGRALGLTGTALTLHLRGGDLRVDLDDDGRAFLTGPAVEVFSGTWTPGGVKP